MMTALLFALLPAAGNFAGGLIAEVLPASSAWRNWTLHAAVGVVLAVVSVEIIPEALTTLAGWQIAVAFVAGGLFYLAIDAIVASGASANRSKMWMIYIAVAADLLGDGLMIGTSSTLTADLALVLAIGQVLADVPEGAASILTFRANDINRRRRLLLSASFAIPTLAGAALSYALLRDRPESWQLMGLVGTAGLFSVAVIEDMISDAHEAEPDNRRSTVALLAGFAAFVLGVSRTRLTNRSFARRLGDRIEATSAGYSNTVGTCSKEGREATEREKPSELRSSATGSSAHSSRSATSHAGRPDRSCGNAPSHRSPGTRSETRIAAIAELAAGLWLTLRR